MKCRPWHSTACANRVHKETVGLEKQRKKKKNGASQAVFSFSTGLQKDSSVQVLILYHFYLFRIRISF